MCEAICGAHAEVFGEQGVTLEGKVIHDVYHVMSERWEQERVLCTEHVSEWQDFAQKLTEYRCDVLKDGGVA